MFQHQINLGQNLVTFCYSNILFTHLTAKTFLTKHHLGELSVGDSLENVDLVGHGELSETMGLILLWPLYLLWDLSRL